LRQIEAELLSYETWVNSLSKKQSIGSHSLPIIFCQPLWRY